MKFAREYPQSGEERKPSGRLRNSWENYIKMDLPEMGWVI
jgi:hypothetical protein